MAGAVMRALKFPCKGVQGRTIHGQRVLHALAAGILPPYVSEWPEEEAAPHPHHIRIV